MAVLRVAGAQIPVTDSIDRNLATILDALEQAADAHAAILLTPEGSLSGYTASFDRDQAEDALRAVTARARELGTGLALGTCRYEEDGRCYNQVRFYDGGGSFLGFHAKILRTGTMTVPPVGEIDRFCASPLRTFTVHGITVGALICNDYWANPECTPHDDPHLVHQLATMGARIIFHAVNGGRDASRMSQEVVKWFHESNLRMRARGARVHVVTVDNAHPANIGVSSPGGVVGPDGEWLTRAPDRGSAVFVEDITVE